MNIINIFRITGLMFTYTSEFSGMSRAFRFLAFSTVTHRAASLKVYFNLICTCAVSGEYESDEPNTPEVRRREASNTPESPATDSSLTAADTDLVFVPDDDVLESVAGPCSISSKIGGGVSEMGESGTSEFS